MSRYRWVDWDVLILCFRLLLVWHVATPSSRSSASYHCSPTDNSNVRTPFSCVHPSHAYTHCPFYISSVRFNSSILRRCSAPLPWMWCLRGIDRMTAMLQCCYSPTIVTALLLYITGVICYSNVIMLQNWWRSQCCRTSAYNTSSSVSVRASW